MFNGRFGEVSLFVDGEGGWWVKLREGTREVPVSGGVDSKQALARIAKFMNAMAALSVRRGTISDGYAMDAVVPPVSHAGEVVEFPRAAPPKRKGRTKRPS